ncbi:MAG: TonB-dependent receptor plug domain-containing protein [Aestuariibacter sp.]
MDNFNLSVDLIDRIEVIKGPGSAVHGADAFSGVINVVTKGYDADTSSDIGLMTGSFGYKSAWVNSGFTKDNFKFAINAQATSTDGDSSRIVEEDALYGLGLGAISHAPGPLDTKLDTEELHLKLQIDGLETSFWYLKNDGGTGAGGAQAIPRNDQSTHEAYNFRIAYNGKLGKNWTISSSATYQDYKGDTRFEIFPPGMALPRQFDENGVPIAFTIFPDGIIGKPITKDSNIELDLTAFYYGWSNHSIRMSFGLLKNDFEVEEYKNFGPLAQTFTEDFRDGSLVDVTGTPFIYSPDAERDVVYVSLQDEWSLAKDWELTAGIRFDDYSDFGSTINPRLALVWQARHNLTIKSLYGKAFRAPSFGELYAINNPIILGNENLDAEEIDTFELALDYRPNFDWKLLFNVFKYRADNLIVYTPQSDGSQQANNAAAQEGLGFEALASWQASDNVELKLSYAWQKPEDADTGEYIADAPKDLLYFAVNWELNDDFTFHFDSKWIKDRARLPSDTRTQIADYNWSNANLNYHLSKNIDLSLLIRNIFDENAREPSDGQIPNDYPLEESGYWLKASYTF